MQYTEILKVLNFDIFLIFAQNIDGGYMQEPPRGSNEYPQSIFLEQKKNKNSYTPAIHSFSIQKWGMSGEGVFTDMLS